MIFNSKARFPQLNPIFTLREGEKLLIMPKNKNHQAEFANK